MTELILAQAGLPTLPFPVPGGDTLPGWAVSIGIVIYISLLAWNAAWSFIKGKQQVKARIGEAVAGAPQPLPSNVIVHGAALADRTAMAALSEGANNLAESISESLGAKSPLIVTLGHLNTSMTRLADVYLKRVEMDERDHKEEEIEKRAREMAEDLIRRKGTNRQ